MELDSNHNLAPPNRGVDLSEMACGGVGYGMAWHGGEELVRMEAREARVLRYVGSLDL